MAGFLNTRSGFSYNSNIQSPNRTGGGGTVNVLLQENGALHYPTFTELDLHFDKSIVFGSCAVFQNDKMSTVPTSSSTV